MDEDRELAIDRAASLDKPDPEEIKRDRERAEQRSANRELYLDVTEAISTFLERMAQEGNPGTVKLKRKRQSLFGWSRQAWVVGYNTEVRGHHETVSGISVFYHWLLLDTKGRLWRRCSRENAGAYWRGSKIDLEVLVDERKWQRFGHKERLVSVLTDVPHNLEGLMKRHL